MKTENIIPIDFSNVSSIQIFGEDMTLNWDSDLMTGSLILTGTEKTDQDTDHLFVNFFFDENGSDWCQLDEMIARECDMFQQVLEENRSAIRTCLKMTSCLMTPTADGIKTKTGYRVWIEFDGNPILSEAELADIAAPLSLEECYG